MSNTTANASLTIETLTGSIRVSAAEIRVSKSPRCERGVFVDLRITATLPGCRKAKLITLMPAMGRIVLRPLYGHNGRADVAPGVFAEFIRSLPVTSCDLFPVTITEDLAAYAIEHELRITNCPAVAC